MHKEVGLILALVVSGAVIYRVRNTNAIAKGAAYRAARNNTESR